MVDKKRLVVTGAGGFVGSHVVFGAGEEWEVHAMARKAPGFGRDNLRVHILDLTHTAQLHEILREIAPQVIIHTAAMADIDRCEANKTNAERINTGLSRDLAQSAAELGAKMVLLSTDTVFNGEKGDYNEEDPPQPINYYAETKAMAEKAVARYGSNWVVARVALVMGLPALKQGNSFIQRMRAVLDKELELGVPDDEYRSPIDVMTLSQALLELGKNDFTGAVHLAGNDGLNRHSMMKRIATRMGYPEKLVVAKDPRGIPGRAPRPLDVTLDNTKARETLQTPMLGFDDGLERIMANDT